MILRAIYQRQIDLFKSRIKWDCVNRGHYFCYQYIYILLSIKFTPFLYCMMVIRDNVFCCHLFPFGCMLGILLFDFLSIQSAIVRNILFEVMLGLIKIYITFQLVVLVGWLLALFVLFLTIYGNRWISCADCNTTKRAAVVAYKSTLRSTFSLCVAWIVFACSTNNGGMCHYDI